VKPNSSAKSLLPPSSPKLLKSLRSTAAFGSKIEEVSSSVPTSVVTVAGDPNFEGEKLNLSLDFNLFFDLMGETDSKPFVDCLLGDTTFEDFGDLW